MVLMNLGALLKSGAIRSFWTQMARKAESVDAGGYLEGKTEFPETARTSIIRHSLMSMIPSESGISHTNMGTTIGLCFVPWSGY